MISFKAPLIFLLAVALSAPMGFGYPLDASLKFSEIIDTIPIGRHFENLTVHHPLYLEIGTGELPLERFQGMIQQDDLYVSNLFKSFSLLAERETDPTRKQFITELGSQNWDAVFKVYYDEFDFSPAVRFVPQVLEYSAYQRTAAKHFEIGAALATVVPCYTIWNKMGAVLSTLADLPNNPNPYKTFVEILSPSVDQSRLVEEYLAFVDGYFERLGNNTAAKQRMIDAYLRAVRLEYDFAEYGYVAEPESVPPPKFPYLVSLVAPYAQRNVIYHPLFEEIGNGTLDLNTFGLFLQQDYIYLRGFYKAFEVMQKKEEDLKVKTLLEKNGAFFYKFFEGLMDKYNFKLGGNAEHYTNEFVEFMIQTAETGSVAEGLGAVYPCYFLWYQMGIRINELADLPNNPNHPYKEFVESQKSSNYVKSMEKMNELIEGVYNRIDKTDVELQLKMFRAVEEGIFQELYFANGVYRQKTT